MADRRIRGALAAVMLVAAACADAEKPGEARQPAAPPPSASAPEPAAAESAAAPAPSRERGFTAQVRRGPAGRYTLEGETGAAAALQLTAEDGHRVLFGPADLEVVDGRFRLEFTPEPTDQGQTTLFLTTADGARQWVIPVPADSGEVTFHEP